MHCTDCGLENSTGARNCVQCGSILSEQCPECKTSLPARANFCPGCGRSISGEAPVKPIGNEGIPFPANERRQVTALFADLADFTTFVQRNDAEEVREIMERLWLQVDEIVRRHGGITEKHIGDATLALFGARQASEDDPVQAVRAGLAIQACVHKLASGGGPSLQMRIGIDTGLVVVGPLAVSGELTATGDAINLANRLEQKAPIGGVLISQETYRNVYGFFDIQPMEPLSVKGRAEPVQNYLVFRPKGRAVAALMRGVAGAPSEMIGRQRELQSLEDALRDVTEKSRLQVITIVGEAGLGKTCLFREFQKHLEELPYFVRLFYGRATAEMSSQSFALIRDLVCARFEIQDNDSALVAREKLEQGICQLVSSSPISGLTTQEWRREAGFIGQLLGLDFSAVPEVSALLKDPDQLRHRAFQSLSRFFATISQAPPDAGRQQVRASLLMAEDVHWSDRASLDLIEHLATSCADVPLLIVCLARPTLLERNPRWGERLPGHTVLTLEPLSKAEGHAMVESILRKTPYVPQALCELILSGAEGIPFFIEEIIKMLIDERVIVPGPEQWLIDLGRLATARVPGSLTGILQARLDRLTSSEREVLQRASVVGRIFWDEIVERLSRAEDRPGGSARPAAERRHRSEISKTLASLRQKELILRRESSAFGDTTEYSFKHELLRTVAYENLLIRARRKYHGQVAVWLVERSGERINEFAGLVAGHFEQADEMAQAAEWYGRAGQQARNSYAPVTAIESFRKALALLPDAKNPSEQTNTRAQRLEWREGLGEVLGAQAHFGEALDVYLQLRLMAEQAGDTLAQARALNGMAYMQERLAKNRASIECAAQAEALARTAGERGRTELVRALLLKGWAFYRLADAAAVLALAEQTSRLCAEFADRRGLATSFKLYGVAHLQLGDFREADDFFTRGLALYQELGDKRNTAAMFSNLGESARARGDYSASAKLYEQGLALARQIGNRDSEAIYLSNLCGARLGLGQFKEAEEDIREAIAVDNTCNLADTYTLLSEACLGQQKHQDALDAALKSLALARESENDLFLGSAWRALGLVATTIETGLAPGLQSTMAPACTGVGLEPLNAEACFSESLRVFQKINAQGEQARTLRAWGEFQWQKKLPAEAGMKLGEAREIFRLLGADSETVRTESLIANLKNQNAHGTLVLAPKPIEPRP